MGLDDFASDGNLSSAGSNTSTSSSSGGSDDEEEREPYKVVGAGDRRKIFYEEDEWEETVEFIEEEMGRDINDVMDLSPSKRHQLIHFAVINKDSDNPSDFHRTRDCLVCGNTFVFPNDWDFEKFKGEPVCKDHKLINVIKAYEQTFGEVEATIQEI